MRVTLFSVIPILIVFIVVFFLLFKRLETRSSSKNLKVLTYSAFLNTWGPGPAISQKFEERTGFHVEFINGGDAGLLLKKLSLFRGDVVLGLDAFAIAKRDLKLKWKTPFVPIDWSPMTFIYRKSEIDPPKSLDDLLDPRFEKKISISDPRTSTPGIQFLLGVLAAKGHEAGIEFLRKLKPNIAFVGSNWSASYGHFKKKQSQLVFSYLTSPVYHWTEEQNFDYQAAPMQSPLTQIEYAVVPASSENIDIAVQFIEFLKTDEIQKIIMQKNFMLPIKQSVTLGTAFERVKVDHFLTEAEMKPESFILEKEMQDILNEWQAIGF